MLQQGDDNNDKNDNQQSTPTPTSTQSSDSTPTQSEQLPTENSTQGPEHDGDNNQQPSSSTSTQSSDSAPTQSAHPSTENPTQGPGHESDNQRIGGLILMIDFPLALLLSSHRHCAHAHAPVSSISLPSAETVPATPRLSDLITPQNVFKGTGDNVPDCEHPWIQVAFADKVTADQASELLGNRPDLVDKAPKVWKTVTPLKAFLTDFEHSQDYPEGTYYLRLHPNGYVKISEALTNLPRITDLQTYAAACRQRASTSNSSRASSSSEQATTTMPSSSSPTSQSFTAPSSYSSFASSFSSSSSQSFTDSSSNSSFTSSSSTISLASLIRLPGTQPLPTSNDSITPQNTEELITSTEASSTSSMTSSSMSSF